jgi:hypothetical protein
MCEATADAAGGFFSSGTLGAPESGGYGTLRNFRVRSRYWNAPQSPEQS